MSPLLIATIVEIDIWQLPKSWFGAGLCFVKPEPPKDELPKLLQHS